MCRLKSTYTNHTSNLKAISMMNIFGEAVAAAKLAGKMWMTQAELSNAINHHKFDTSNVSASSSSSKGTKRKRGKKLNHEMKEGIWRQLPRDVVLQVIAKLPIPELFRARSIDTSANNMVFEFLCREREYSLSIRGVEVDGSSSSGFLRMHHHDLETSNRNISLVILQPLVLDCNRHAWYKLPFFPFQGATQRRSLVARAAINARLY